MDKEKCIDTILNRIIDVDENYKEVIRNKLLNFISMSEHIEISDKDLYINLMIKTAELLSLYEQEGGDKNGKERESEF